MERSDTLFVSGERVAKCLMGNSEINRGVRSRDDGPTQKVMKARGREVGP